MCAMRFSSKIAFVVFKQFQSHVSTATAVFPSSLDLCKVSWCKDRSGQDSLVAFTLCCSKNICCRVTSHHVSGTHVKRHYALTNQNKTRCITWGISISQYATLWTEVLFWGCHKYCGPAPFLAVPQRKGHTAAAIAPLRRQGTYLATSLDDWLLLGQSEREAKAHMHNFALHLPRLGFVMNAENSEPEHFNVFGPV